MSQLAEGIKNATVTTMSAECHRQNVLALTIAKCDGIVDDSDEMIREADVDGDGRLMTEEEEGRQRITLDTH